MVPPSPIAFCRELDRAHLASEPALTSFTLAQADELIGAVFKLKRPVRADFLDSLYRPL